MKHLLDNITAYLAYLNNDCGLCTTVHFSETLLRQLPESVFSRLLPYNVHTNPYCTLVKKTSWARCIHAQGRVMAKACTDGHFCGTCYAGVQEYIHPIHSGNAVVGYVAVSGYRSESPAAVCPDIGIWQKHLRSEPVPEALCSAVIPPLCCMLEQLVSAPIGADPESEHNLILHFITERQGQVTLDELCSHFGRSRSYISHSFRAKSGTTLRAYCIHLRLEHARRLLQQTGLPVTEIAMETGFTDTSHFIALFREKYGTTPLQFRKGCRIGTGR